MAVLQLFSETKKVIESVPALHWRVRGLWARTTGRYTHGRALIFAIAYPLFTYLTHDHQQDGRDQNPYVNLTPCPRCQIDTGHLNFINGMRTLR